MLMLCTAQMLPELDGQPLHALCSGHHKHARRKHKRKKRRTEAEKVSHYGLSIILAGFC